MLVKKELLSVPVPPVPKCQKYKYKPMAQIVDLPKSGQILAVDYYTENGLFSRFFCDGKNYCVFRTDRQAWGTGYPVPGSSGYYEGNLDRDSEADDVCNSFFTLEQQKWRAGVDEVNRFIYQRNYDRRALASANADALMRQHMGMFPAYPDNLPEYCNDQVFDNNYIFISKADRKGNRQAVCSNCGKQFSIGKGSTSGKEGICPECHAKATYRGNWFKADVEDKADICIAYRVDNQLLIRWTHVYRYFPWPGFEAKFRFDDYAYSLYTVKNGQQRIYTYKWFKAPYAYGAEWHRLPADCTCDSSSYVYTNNLDEVFGSTIYNVNLKAGLTGKRVKLSFVNLLDNLKSNRKAEYLFKLGLPVLAQDAGYMRGDPDGQGAFQKAVGISKQYLPMLRDMNVTTSEIRTIRNAKEWVSPELLQRYRSLKTDSIPAISDLIGKLGLSRTLNYLDRQCKQAPHVSTTRIAIAFQDYLNMSEDLHVDLSHKSVRFTSDIIDAHMTITERYNAVKKEKEMEKAKVLNQDFHECVSKRYAELGLTEFEQKGFCIVLPQLRTDLIAEGQSLNHCVGGDSYYKNHMLGVRMIFFIRKASAPEKPFFTMELNVESGQILQLYGFGDCSATKDVRAFAEAFARYTQRKKARKTA